MSKYCMGKLMGLKALGLAVYGVCTLCFFVSCGDDSTSGSDSKYEMRLCDSTSVGAVDSLDGVQYICGADGWAKVLDSSSVEPAKTDSLGQGSFVSHQDTATSTDSLNQNSTVGDSTQRHDTSEVVQTDPSNTDDKDPSKLENVMVTGSFGYGIFDSRSSVVVEVLDESFKKTGSSFPATISAKDGAYSADRLFARQSA